MIIHWHPWYNKILIKEGTLFGQHVNNNLEETIWEALKKSLPQEKHQEEKQKIDKTRKVTSFICMIFLAIWKILRTQWEYIPRSSEKL